MTTVEALRHVLATEIAPGGDQVLVVDSYDAAELLSIIVNADGASGAIRGPESRLVDVNDSAGDITGVSELEVFTVSLAELYEGEGK